MGVILLLLLIFIACTLGAVQLIDLALEERISWWVCVALVAVVLVVLWSATPDLVFGPTGSA